MENGCPVLPRITRNNEKLMALEALTVRADIIMKRLAETDQDKAASFMKNFEHLKERGDPMIEWFIISRELIETATDDKKNQVDPDSSDYYSF